MNTLSYFQQAPITHFKSHNAALAIRKYGSGTPLIFIHGFPTHGYTWRHILPALAKKYTCYLLDMPGLGESKWDKKTDFHFKTQAQRIVDFIDKKGFKKCSIIAHDTGATTARFATLATAATVEKLILINTEVPFHRPPWIPFYQLIGQLPFAHLGFRLAMSNGPFLRSPMGFRAFYANKKLLKVPTNLSPYIAPVVASNAKMKGMLSYLRGCDLAYMDTLKDLHYQIEAKVFLIWGAKDVTFPVKYGRSMLKQFKNAQFFKLEYAALMPHEECPEEVVKIILNN